MTLWLTLLAQIALCLVAVDALVHMTGGVRRHRVGVTLFAAWAVFSLLTSLSKITDPFPVWASKSTMTAMGTFLAAWAVWDLTRLQRVYGTSTLLSAAELARSFLQASKIQGAIWELWASSLPKAAWLKGTNGMMLALNRHYEDKYGKREYVGATDHQMWKDEHADQFTDNDKRVFTLGEPVIVTENAPIQNDPHRTSIFLKFPVRDARGEVVGIGGIELLEEHR